MHIRALASVLLFLTLAVSGSAAAENWTHYDNARFGFSIAIPPAFTPQGESDNDDGQSFALAGRPALLSAWGGYLMSDFEDEIASAIEAEAANGWLLGERSTGPRWAIWSAGKGGRILLQRVILLCDGISFAAFRLEYSQADRNLIDPMIDRITPSLAGETC